MSRALLVLLAFVLAAGCVGAGVWQLDRARQKQQRLDAFADALASTTPVPLADALDAPEQVPLQVEGRLQFPSALPWLLLDNQIHDQAVGVRVYRLARLAGAGSRGVLLLVEFGWRPLPPDRALPTLPAAPATLDARGFLLPPPSPGLRLIGNPAPQALQRSRLLTALVPAELAAELHQAVDPRVLRLAPELPVGYARDLDVLPNTLPPEQHRAYALQWFGFAAALLIATAILFVRSLRR